VTDTPAVIGPITTDDWHTGGEPFRIVTGGVPIPEGHTVLDRRSWAMEHLDDVRAFLTNEPRGHGGMYGCFVTPPDDDGAELGLVFFHKDGFSTACGHGTIAAASWGRATGRLRKRSFAIDVPSGRVRVDVDDTDEVRFTNVASYVSALDLEVDGLTIDVAYGGAFYAVVDVDLLDSHVHLSSLPRLAERTRTLKRALVGHPALQHATDDRLSGCYGVIWFERVGERHQRNVTIFADGEVDRSPCGSGTSARLAILDARGELARGDTLLHESIVGSTFTARVVGEASDGVITEVGGRAHRTGEHRFVLDPHDALGLGFQL
jgi:proline racemase